MSDVIKEKAQYWLELADKRTHRGAHYQSLCCYKIAAQDFFEIRDKEQLRLIFKKRPDVKGLLHEEIVAFVADISSSSFAISKHEHADA